MAVVNPFMVKNLINWFVNPKAEVYKGYVFTSVIFAIALSRPFINQHSNHYAYKSIVNTYSLIYGSFFKKFETISMSATRYMSTDLITSSTTFDIVKIINFTLTYPSLIVSPMVLVAYLVILCLEVGWVGIIGMLIIVIMPFLQILMSKKMQMIARLKSSFLEQRNKQVKNALLGIKTIKFSHWEEIVSSVIDKIRIIESSISRRSTIIRGFMDSISFMTPLLASFVTILIYQSVSEKLSLGSVFFIISSFNSTLIPLKLMMFSIVTYIEAKFGLSRFTQIFTFPDQDPSEDVSTNDESLPIGSVSIRNATLSFENKKIREKISGVNDKAFVDKSKTKTLVQDNDNLKLNDQDFEGKSKKTKLNEKAIFNNFSLEIKPNQFVVIIGTLGCGKTSLLKSILGGLFFQEGSIKKNGRLAYISQESFLINGSFRENIIFGNEYNEGRYQHILKICELLPDLKILSAGDSTEIGERGVNLSGGQKQRITIARALYVDADIFLVDDSLSAVDAYVGQSLFNNVFKSELSGKTILMITHNLEILPEVDRILMLQEGNLVADGTYNNLISSNQNFKEFVRQTELDLNKKKKENLSKANNSIHLNGKLKSLKGIQRESNEPESAIDKNLEISSKNKVGSMAFHPANQKNLIELPNTGKLTKSESLFRGQIGIGRYYEFFKKGNFFFFLVCMFFFASGVAGKIVADWWVGSWSVNLFPNFTFNQSLLTYFGIIMVTFAIMIVRSVLWGVFTSKLSYGLFSDLVKLILRKKMIFFETTPLGQILNLTSNDTELIDSSISGTFMNFFSNFFAVIGTYILVSVTNVIVIPVIFTVIVLNFMIVRRYLRVSIELRRLEQISYSPILSSILELCYGLAIFRTNSKSRFQEKVYNRNINTLLSIVYHDKVITLHSNFLTETMMAMLIGISFYLFCIGKTFSLSFVVSNPGFIALCISWLMTIPMMIQLTMFMFAETSKGMSSVQRVMNNIDDKSMEREAGDLNPPGEWPINGEIRVVNISARYRPNLPLVIKNLTFIVRPKEKIGIVGRTGSGKSTMVLLMTRLLEVDDEEEGFIEVDGYRIHKMDLGLLRSKIKVIPQDPYILKGSLRSNIDPLNKFSDERVIDALKKCMLWDSHLLANSDHASNLPLANDPIGRTFENNKFSIKDDIRQAEQNNESHNLLLLDNGEVDLLNYNKDVCFTHDYPLVISPHAKVMKESEDCLQGKIDLIKKAEGIDVSRNKKTNDDKIRLQTNAEILESGELALKKHPESISFINIQEKNNENISKLNFVIEDGGRNISVGENSLFASHAPCWKFPKY
jgi:ABC-type multidrug transport system fused ATPase/permease subunit